MQIQFTVGRKSKKQENELYKRKAARELASLYGQAESKRGIGHSQYAVVELNDSYGVIINSFKLVDMRQQDEFLKIILETMDGLNASERAVMLELHIQKRMFGLRRALYQIGRGDKSAISFEECIRLIGVYIVLRLAAIYKENNDVIRDIVQYSRDSDLPLFLRQTRRQKA